MDAVLVATVHRTADASSMAGVPARTYGTSALLELGPVPRAGRVMSGARVTGPASKTDGRHMLRRAATTGARRIRWFFASRADRIRSLRVGCAMDKQTRHEIWLLTIGTILLEAPVAFAAFTILSH